MSFILDALRKSEHERQRQAGPAIADLRATAPRASLPIWAIAIAALLAVNLIVVLVLVIRGELQRPELNAAPSASTSIAPASGAVDLVAEPTLPLNSEPRKPISTLAPEPQTTPSRNDYQTNPYAAPATEAAFVEPQLRSAARMSPQLQAERDASLPTIHDLNLQGADALPELRLDIHVYAKRPAERFVFINMHKYKEGEQTTEGVKIERITADGVVLNRHGKQFLLPRQ